MYEPIPWDEDCQANITTSICDSEAIEEFRYCFMKESPVATLMGTDGIDDSYANFEEMYQAIRHKSPHTVSCKAFQDSSMPT